MPELQEIFDHVYSSADTSVPMSPQQAKAFHMIRHCRSAKLGAHAMVCSECGSAQVSYNSCRNRHCPKCQHAIQEDWVQAQLDKLLPVGYFHVVFTLPHELNPLLLYNQKLLYSLLLRAASHTLVELAKDPKYLGAAIGLTSVLHTWGRNLSFHPHVHVIVPGGGLSSDGLRFVRSRKKFFIPVKVISKKFRGKFLYFLKKAYADGKLEFFHVATPSNFASLIDSLYAKKWVVFCKKPFKSPEHVVRYLGRYTHRVAISNSRIKSFDGKSVSFFWKDYKDKGKSKVMTLNAAEFTRRFLQHVLPDGFVKIRHYGLLCSRNIHTKLLRCRQLAKGKLPDLSSRPKVRYCPCCGSSKVIFVRQCFPSTVT
ncbi:IS91 family transposase [Dehalococcoides sp. HCBD]|uniref:IS91 family transposase n=1 Tax=Dehalococcoides sp. HCBD TaxID=3440628 RepID=UPI003F5C809E